MANLTSSHAINSLSFLAEFAAGREAENDRLNTTRDLHSSDEEADSLSPFLGELCLNGYSESILKLTAFTGPEFEEIWSNLE